MVSTLRGPSLIEGLTYQRLLTPELFPDDVIYAAFAAFAGGGSKPRRTRKSVKSR